MNDICIKAENLSKYFLVLKAEKTTLRALKMFIKGESFKRKFWVLRNVSFKVEKGDKLALIGKNGTGKTTLLRILTGIYSQSSGRVEINGDPAALFRFLIGFNKDLSIIDNIYLFGAAHGLGRSFLKQKVHNILEMAGLYNLRFSSIKELSRGQVQRLAFSVFSQTTNDLLIFDESLGFVDKEFVKKCEVYFQKLYSSDKTVIITSHDNSFLRKYCKKALWLDKSYIRMFGEAGEVIDEYEQSLNI